MLSLKTDLNNKIIEQYNTIIRVLNTKNDKIDSTIGQCESNPVPKMILKFGKFQIWSCFSYEWDCFFTTIRKEGKLLKVYNVGYYKFPKLIRRLINLIFG